MWSRAGSWGGGFRKPALDGATLCAGEPETSERTRCAAKNAVRGNHAIGQEALFEGRVVEQREHGKHAVQQAVPRRGKPRGVPEGPTAAGYSFECASREPAGDGGSRAQSAACEASPVRIGDPF